MESKITITKAVEHLNTIVKDIEKLIEDGNDFVAFVVLSIGIEFLGGFKDEKNFEESMSEARFKNGLSLFKNSWYKNHKVDLFKQLRGALIHQYRPGDIFFLTSIKVSNVSEEEHLKKREGKTVLVLECFLAEYKRAISNLENKYKTLNRAKREEEYLVVKNIKKEEIKSGISGRENLNVDFKGYNDTTEGYQVSGITVFNDAKKGKS